MPSWPPGRFTFFLPGILRSRLNRNLYWHLDSLGDLGRIPLAFLIWQSQVIFYRVLEGKSLKGCFATSVLNELNSKPVFLGPQLQNASSEICIRGIKLFLGDLPPKMTQENALIWDRILDDLGPHKKSRCRWCTLSGRADGYVAGGGGLEGIGVHSWTTVDGRNPAPVHMVMIPLSTGFHTSQVVQDLSHQQ